MQAESSYNFEQQVLARLDKLNTVEACQKASTQVTNLAFALISAATVTVIVSAVLGR